MKSENKKGAKKAVEMNNFYRFLHYYNTTKQCFFQVL